jgi:UDPglucose 6-dehydrogenase
VRTDCISHTRGLDRERVRRELEGRVFVDLRNLYEPAEMPAAGFDYHRVGR